MLPGKLSSAGGSTPDGREESLETLAALNSPPRAGPHWGHLCGHMPGSGEGSCQKGQPGAQVSAQVAAGARPGGACAAWEILGAAVCPCRLLAGSRLPCHLHVGPVYKSTLFERGFEQRDKHLLPASKNVFKRQALRAHVLPSLTRHLMCAPVPQTGQKFVGIFMYIHGS